MLRSLIPSSKETVSLSQDVTNDIHTTRSDNFSHSIKISSSIVQPFPVSSAEERVNEGFSAAASPPRHEANARANTDEGLALITILEELRDFRREFQEFKSDLVRANNRITEAETRIAKMEDRVQNVEQVMLNMLKIIGEQENKIADQDSWAWRKNLRLYNVPEGAEGSSMPVFVEKVLTECLDLPSIERSHRALGAVRNREGTPRSILICFARFDTKEEVLRKAWAKRTVLLNGQRIYFDQDYAPAILRKRKDYAEAKRDLKQQNIRFQMPYPAKLRVFYQEGTGLYSTAEEATLVPMNFTLQLSAAWTNFLLKNRKCSASFL
uniref:L1 transposable element RRM domain-containing protein n=1 Tax=Haplochromis burtoni TaxID=8153 RepID=A0A3Q3D174_HAPBU